MFRACRFIHIKEITYLLTYLYSTHGEHKSAVVERFNRTLKTNMWRRFTAENTRNWIDMLDKLLFEYNNRYHTTIRMKPIDAALKENKSGVWNNVYDNASKNEKNQFSKIQTWRHC